MAEEHQEINKLIPLDEKGINEDEQEIYLLSHGYITGQKDDLNKLAKKFNIPPEQMRHKLGEIESLISSK